jgi:hypothetical protein
MRVRTAANAAKLEQAKALFFQGLTLPLIAQAVSVPLSTINKWSQRGKWSMLKEQTKGALVQGLRKDLAIGIIPPSSPQNALAPASRRLREQLASELEAQAAVLAQNPVQRVSELGNTPQGEGRASVVKRIAETAAIVHDWDQSTEAGLVIVTDMKGSAPEELAPAIDVQQLPAAPDEAGQALAALAAED